VCGRRFTPDPRRGVLQRCCSRKCRREWKRRYDREYLRAYRALPDAPKAKREENLRYRARVDWARYMRFWRKAEAYRRPALERKRAQRYYERHAEEIRAKAKSRRASKKAVERSRSH
jgi:hypothetical protein